MCLSIALVLEYCGWCVLGMEAGSEFHEEFAGLGRELRCESVVVHEAPIYSVGSSHTPIQPVGPVELPCVNGEGLPDVFPDQVGELGG